jgi:hypothetical protein
MMDRDDRRLDDGLDPLFAALREAAGRGADAPVAWERVAAAARRRRRTRRVLAGTAVTLAFGAAVALVWFRPRTAPQGPPPTEVVAETPELRLFLPSPGIRVVADRDARISSVETDALRLAEGTVWVELDASGGPRPFRVDTRFGSVHARGTRFAVRLAGCRGLTVAVERGRVEAIVRGRSVPLEAGWEWQSREQVSRPITEPWATSFERFLGSARVVAALPVADRPRAETPPDPAAPPDDPPAPLSLPPDPAATPAVAAPPLVSGNGRDRDPPPPGPADTEDARYREAERFLAEDRVEEAARILETLSSEAPGSRRSGAALLDLATASLRLGRTSDAIAAYRRYLDEQPRGGLRGEARISLCRLLAGPDGTRPACYAAYVEEFPDGPYVEEARRFAPGEAHP